MPRILTGIQSTGRPHLGNLLGAIIPAIKLSKESDNQSLFFIADLHSFTTIRNSKELRDNTYATAAAWLAFLGVAARQTESVHDARDFVVAREGAALVQAKDTGA